MLAAHGTVGSQPHHVVARSPGLQIETDNLPVEPSLVVPGNRAGEFQGRKVCGQTDGGAIVGTRWTHRLDRAGDEAVAWPVLQHAMGETRPAGRGIGMEHGTEQRHRAARLERQPRPPGAAHRDVHVRKLAVKVVRHRDHDQFRFLLVDQAQARPDGRPAQVARRQPRRSIAFEHLHRDRPFGKPPLGLGRRQAQLGPQRLPAHRRIGIDIGDVVLLDHVVQRQTQAIGRHPPRESAEDLVACPGAVEIGDHRRIELAGQPETALLGQQQHLAIVDDMGGKMGAEANQPVEFNVGQGRALHSIPSQPRSNKT